MFLRLIEVIFSIFLILNPVKAFQPNVVFNLSVVEINTVATSFTFQPIILDPNFSFGSCVKDLNLHIKYYHKITTNETYIAIGNNKIEGVFSYRLPKSCSQCIKLSYFYELSIDDILNSAFKCTHPVTDYVSKIYVIKKINYKLFKREDVRNIGIYSELYVFWIITRQKFFVLDNELNYQKFMAECLNISASHYVFIFLGIFFGVFLSYAATVRIVERTRRIGIGDN